MTTNPHDPRGKGAARKRVASRQPAPGPAPKSPSHDQFQNRREFGDCSTLWDTSLSDITALYLAQLGPPPARHGHSPRPLSH